MAHIYKITNPKGKIYVGSSVNVKKRFAGYRRNACEGQILLFRSFQKYGVGNHSFEIITECAETEMYRLEAYYGSLYRSLKPYGLNLALPKSDMEYTGFSEDVKEKMRLKKVGIKLSEEHKKKISDSTKGKNTWNSTRVISEETKQKLRKAKKGVKPPNWKGKKRGPISEEHRDKLRAAKLCKSPWNKGLTTKLKIV